MTRRVNSDADDALRQKGCAAPLGGG